jgi:hypothetical protein
MMLAPVDFTESVIMPFTVAAVPTGMKTGVSTAPHAVVRRPRRAMPSVAFRVNPNFSVCSDMAKSVNWFESSEAGHY